MELLLPRHTSGGVTKGLRPPEGEENLRNARIFTKC